MVVRLHLGTKPERGGRDKMPTRATGIFDQGERCAIPDTAGTVRGRAGEAGEPKRPRRRFLSDFSPVTPRGETLFLEMSWLVFLVNFFAL